MDDGLNIESVFGAALGLAAPWQVREVEFDPTVGQVDISLDFVRGSRFVPYCRV